MKRCRGWKLLGTWLLAAAGAAAWGQGLNALPDEAGLSAATPAAPASAGPPDAPPAPEVGQALDVTEAELTAQSVKDALFPNDECEELKRNGIKCATPLIAPVPLVFRDVLFETGRATLTERFMRQLQPLAEALRGRDPSHGRVRIEGHTDASGPARLNDSLSTQRAAAVARYLAALGVDARLLQPIGLGSRRLKEPAAPNSAQNRRVEFRRAE